MTAAHPRRLVACLLDWYLCAILCGAPVLLLNSMRTGSTQVNASLLALGDWAYGAGSLALLLGVGYYLLIPRLIWPGQTPGKRLLRLRITTLDGGVPGWRALLLRQCVGVLLLEGLIAFPSQFLREMLTLALPGAAAPALLAAQIFTFGSIVCGVLRRDRRMLHDLLGGTREVSVEK